MSHIRLFIVEDQPRILKAQIKMLANYHDIEMVGVAQSGEDALEALAGLRVLPDIVLCDIGLPHMSGIQLARIVRVRYAKTNLLMFTVLDEETMVLQAIQAGAAGYILKGCSPAKLVEAIREVHNGGTIIQPSLAKKILKYFNAPLIPHDKPAKQTSYPITYANKVLTERELECLQMIGKGLSNAEAAEVLGLSKATVRTHLEHIYAKLEVCNRVEAVTEGIRQGMIDI